MERPLFSDRLISRRTAIGGGLVALSPLAFPRRVWAQGNAADDSFVLLLKGLYQPVVHAPNLGLSSVNLRDGSYSTTKIYPVRGIPGQTNLDKAVGDFYVQFDGDLCAYHVPGGSFAMRFTGSNTGFVPDGQGGRFLEGTFELTVLEATGDLSAVCRWPQPHGRQAALPRSWRWLRRLRRILLLLRQPSMNDTLS